MKRYVVLFLVLYTCLGSVLGQRSDIAIRTNVVYDACLTPNIGVEMNVGRQMSVGVNGMCAWWSRETDHKYWRVWGGEVFGRWWLGRDVKENDFRGHHVGVYAGGITYDIKLKTTGKGEIAYPFNWYCGAEYGYSLRLCRRLNLDCSIGIGYVGGKYKTYESLPVSSFTDDYHNVWQETNRRNFIGPTKAEVSLVWLLDVRKKGGEQ